MSATFNRLGIGSVVEDHVSDIKVLAFVLKQLVVSASADTGFALDSDERARFERGSQILVTLIDEHSAAIVDLAYRGEMEGAK